MRILSKFSCVQIHNKQDNSDYSTHIILQCKKRNLKTLKRKYMLNLTSYDKTSETLLHL